MANLTIKNLPDSLYALLKVRAAEHRRSINSEAILAVERGLTPTRASDPVSLLATLRRNRSRITDIYLTDKDFRAGRRSGRA